MVKYWKCIEWHEDHNNQQMDEVDYKIVKETADGNLVEVLNPEEGKIRKAKKWYLLDEDEK